MTDTGEIGENLFDLWCSQAQLTANPARRDKFGWDFFVQFPRLDVASPLDARLPQLMCMVQVKTTAAGEHRAAIKLDNWERMVGDPMPWFVFAIELDDVVPREAYLIHIGEEYAGRVLKRLRELRRDDPAAADQLHKKHMDVSWGEADRLATMSGASMKEAMIRHIGEDLRGYAETKMGWSKSLGYDDHPREITIAITGDSPEDIYRQVRDFAVGIDDRLTIYLQSITDHRFGIPIKEVDLTQESKDVQRGHLGPGDRTSGNKAEISISDAARTSVVVFSCDTFGAQWDFPSLPREYWRHRFVANCASFIMDQPRDEGTKWALNVQVNFPVFGALDEGIKIDDLAKVGRAIRLLDRAQEQGVRFEVCRDEARWSPPIQYGPLGLSPEAVSMAEVFENLGTVVNMLGIGSDLEVVPDEILAFGHRIHILRCGLQGTQLFPLRLPGLILPADEANEKTIAFLIGAAVPIGNRVINGAFALIGKAAWVKETETEAAEIVVERGEARVLWQEIAPATEWSVDGFAAKLQEADVKLKGEGIGIVLVPPRGSPIFDAFFI